AVFGSSAELALGTLVTFVAVHVAVAAVLALPLVISLQRSLRHSQLVAEASVDAKTGLLNDRTWRRRAAEAVEQAVREGAPVAVGILDIDHFKAVNDTHGHLVGDKTLRAVTDALQSQLRNYDLAGRFGGEEFVILLPHAREVDALNVAERLRAHIAAMSVPVGDDPESGAAVRVTISVGVSSLDGTTRELTDMLAAADAALYYAKETGRNKTHVSPASAPAS
ncbi:MAG TPA: GGDEF domain-containing protein, partial [Streptosporangiaceae bacterium]|nr:GGDEF domain-containing protein [Streptosporangiaceae bacterium]